MKVAKLFEAISTLSLYAIVALLPVWFLPITQNIVGYQKQTLLVAFVLVGFISWFVALVSAGEIRFRNTWLHIPVIGVLAAVGISVIFSHWRYGSFWGLPLDTADNFLALGALVLLYFLVSQNARDMKELIRIFGVFVVSVTVAIVLAILQMKGIFLLGFGSTESELFNTLGPVSSVAVLAALLIPTSLALASWSEKIWKGILWGCSGLLLVALILLNFFGAWVVAVIGLGAFAVLDMVGMQKQTKKARMYVSMTGVVVGLFFMVVSGFSIPGAIEKQELPSVRYGEELSVIQNLIEQDPKSVILGRGPGTFAYNYAQFRSAESNVGPFWSIRFISGSAEILDWIITKGSIGVIALGSLIAFSMFFLFEGIKKSQTKNKEDADDIVIRDVFEENGKDHSVVTAGVLASLMGFVAALALFPITFVMWTLFWMLMGAVAIIAGKEIKISLSGGPSYAALVASIGLMVVLVGGIGLAFLSGQKYYAEVVYFQGVKEASAGNQDGAIEKITLATRINSQVDVYWRSLAQLHLGRANRIAADMSVSAEVRQQQAGNAVNSALQSITRATEVGSINVANWNVRGFVYRNLIGVSGADTFAVESYGKAHELEPASPFALTEIGRVKILSAQVDEGNDGDFEGAIEYLERAISLKNDYAPAHYLVAVAYAQSGNQAETIAKLEDTKIVAPNDIGLAFQLGVLYYGQEQFGKARDEFERAKLLSPGYSNARYMLGLVYDRLGRREDAAMEFGIVAELNPNNQEVQVILQNLQQGRSALFGIGESSEPPIEDAPPEIEAEETNEEQFNEEQ